MPLAFSLDPLQINGKRRQVTGTVTFDNSYVTGGEPFTARDFGLDLIEHVSVEARNGYVISWNSSASAPTLLAHQQSAATGALTQVPNATDLSTLSVDIMVIGY